MSKLNEILEAENRAKDMVAKAKEDALTRVVHAEDLYKKEITMLQEKLTKVRTDKIALEKPRLAEKYKATLEEADKESERLRESAIKKKHIAVEYVLKHL